ncbi:hypothetical protein J2T20_000347 [Paenibacillus wynnii]|nr:hypothetical protein [Paenibacillus wynnii]
MLHQIASQIIHEKARTPVQGGDEIEAESAESPDNDSQSSITVFEQFIPIIYQ